MTIHLSPRLRAVAECVPPGARVIDVGTDHAMIPVWLAQTGRAAHIWASDIRPGPLQGAADLMEETQTGDRIDLRLTDGLQGFTADDADTVLIAGLGGETMVSILADAPWTKNDTLLVLSPHTKQDVLRRFLAENGYVIHEEHLIRDAGRIYPLFTASGGVSPAYSEAEYHTGQLSLVAGEEAFGDYLTQLEKRCAAAAPYDQNAAALLREYEQIKESWIKCRR